MVKSAKHLYKFNFNRVSPVRIPFLQTPLLRHGKRRLRHHHQRTICMEPLELCLHRHLPLGHRHHHYQWAIMMEPELCLRCPLPLCRRHHPDLNGGLRPPPHPPSPALSPLRPHRFPAGGRGRRGRGRRWRRGRGGRGGTRRDGFFQIVRYAVNLLYFTVLHYFQ